MNFELKPCPFCGGSARIENAGEGSYRVVCSGCRARSGRIFVKRWHSTKFVAQGQVAKLWNVRVPAAPELIEEPSPLLDYIKQEVPFRLKEIFNIPDEALSQTAVDDCIFELYDNSDVMFDYDSLDDFLTGILERNGIHPDDYKEESK